MAYRNPDRRFRTQASEELRRLRDEESAAVEADDDVLVSGDLTIPILMGVLFVGMVILSFLAFWRVQRTSMELDRQSAQTLDAAARACGVYDAETGVYEMTRGGVRFAPRALPDTQHLTGFSSGCAECGPVAGAAFGSPTPASCTEYDDSAGGAGARRAKADACGGATEFTSAVRATAVVGNLLSASSKRVAMSPVGGWPGGRCDSVDEPAVPGTSALYETVLRSDHGQARDLYFVTGGAGQALCYCQPCGHSGETSALPAGAGAPCGTVGIFSSGTSEVCVYAPTGGWSAGGLL